MLLKNHCCVLTLMLITLVTACDNNDENVVANAQSDCTSVCQAYQTCVPKLDVTQCTNNCVNFVNANAALIDGCIGCVNTNTTNYCNGENFVCGNECIGVLGTAPILEP